MRRWVTEYGFQGSVIGPGQGRFALDRRVFPIFELGTVMMLSF
jgi:hypothetical protein